MWAAAGRAARWATLCAAVPACSPAHSRPFSRPRSWGLLHPGLTTPGASWEPGQEHPLCGSSACPFPVPGREGSSLNGVGMETASLSHPLPYQLLSSPLGQGGKYPPAVGCARGIGGETALSVWQGQGFCLILPASLPRSWLCSGVRIAGGF